MLLRPDHTHAYRKCRDRSVAKNRQLYITKHSPGPFLSETLLFSPLNEMISFSTVRTFSLGWGLGNAVNTG